MTTETENPINDYNLPAYPSGLLPTNTEFDPPIYDGDQMDLTWRRNTKLYNVWLLWSNLRKDEKLFKLLNDNTSKKNSELFYLKTMMVLTLDRLGKILADTNLVEELKVEGEKSRPRPVLDETVAPPTDEEENKTTDE